jgi:hypothetical protein
MSCTTCQQSNPENAKIEIAVIRGKKWAKEKELTSFMLVKMVNGAYSYKALTDDLTNFEEIGIYYL